MDIENKDTELEIEEQETKQDSKESDYEDVCFMCHRPESKTGKMIHLTQDISICSECMQKTFDAMNNAYLVLGEKVGNAFRDGAALR